MAGEDPGLVGHSVGVRVPPEAPVVLGRVG